MNNLRDRHFEREFIFSTSRSSGPGGQNVNKVSSKVELRFSITDSQCLDDSEKQIISQRLSNNINKEGELIIVCQISRSQLTNKKLTVDTFFRLLENALTPVKLRKSTKPTHASVIHRLAIKKIKSDKKNQRGFRFNE